MADFNWTALSLVIALSAAGCGRVPEATPPLAASPSANDAKPAAPLAPDAPEAPEAPLPVASGAATALR